MILQEKDYIKRQKKKYSIHACIWTIIVFILFGIGVLLTGTRSNLFTISACLMAIVAALFITRLISFNRFKDGNEELVRYLEGMKGDYHLFHSGIVLDAKGTSYFEHIVVTSRNIYFISYDEQVVKKNRLRIEENMVSKGLSSKHIHLLVVSNEKQMKNIVHRIEKDAVYLDGKLEEYSKIISETLM